MKKYLAVRYFKEKDYLYSIIRAKNLELASESLENKLIQGDFKDEGIFTITPLVQFNYKNNRIIFPEGTEKQTVVIAPIGVNPFSIMNERLKV